MYTNAPESTNLTKEENQVFEAGRAAAASLAKTFELWITVARAVELARIKADRIGTRQAFQRILEQQGLAGVLGNSWASQKSTANKLLTILDHLPEVEQWRSSLSQAQRINWSAPTTVYKHCPLFGNAALAKLNEPAKEPSGIDWNPEDEEALRHALAKAAVENQKLAADLAERNAEAAELRVRLGTIEMVNAQAKQTSHEANDAYLAALQSEVEALKTTIETLTKENTELKGRIRELETSPERDEKNGEDLRGRIVALACNHDDIAKEIVSKAGVNKARSIQHSLGYVIALTPKPKPPKRPAG
jgi:hypothetical protein